MRTLTLCALMAATALATTDAEAGRRRRDCRNYGHHYGYNHVNYGYNTVGLCGQTAACGAWGGQTWGTANYAPTTTYAHYTHYAHYAHYAPAMTAPAACAPAQPVTYSAGYAPLSNQPATAPVTPPPPEAIDNRSENVDQYGRLEAAPAPQPVDNTDN